MGLLSAVSPGGAQAVFFESTEVPGRIVIDAESAPRRAATSQHAWRVAPEETPATLSNFRGSGYIRVLPDSGGGGAPNAPPYVEYPILIETVGQYRLWLRWVGPNDGGDTLYASLVELQDGSGGANADWYRYVRITDGSDFTAGGIWFGSAGFERTDSPPVERRIRRDLESFRPGHLHTTSGDARRRRRTGRDSLAARVLVRSDGHRTDRLGKQSTPTSGAERWWGHWTGVREGIWRRHRVPHDRRIGPRRRDTHPGDTDRR